MGRMEGRSMTTDNPWQPIANAPKDRPVLVYYDHSADPYHDPENPNRITDYAANADGVGFVPGHGQIVAMWCDGYHEDDGYESFSGSYWVPGGWFPCINGEPQDDVCNALFWRELDANPQAPFERDGAS